MRKLLYLIVLMILITKISEANTGVFFGAGNQVMPIKNTAVQLVSEKVQMKITIDKNSGKFGAPFIPMVNVTATFNLRNTTKKTEKLQMGFPFLDLQGFGDEKAVISDMNFQVLSDGKELKSTIKTGVIEKKLDPNGLFKKVFVWNDKFLPRQHKKIVVKYRMLMGVASMSSLMRDFDSTGLKYDELDQLFSAMGYNFFYITKTAYTWKGEIESAEFEVDCRALLNELDERIVQSHLDSVNLGKKSATDNSFYQDRMERAAGILSAIKRPVFLESHSPAEYKGNDGIYSWKFTKAVPSDGISLNFIILFMPSSIHEYHSYTKAALSVLKEPTPEEFYSTLKTYYRILLSMGEPQDEFTKGYFKEINWLLQKPKLVFSEDNKHLQEINEVH
jgi:hypothetical protein